MNAGDEKTPVESRIQRAARRLQATMQEEGLRGAVDVGRGYLRWRMAGSPHAASSETAVPDFAEWREVFELVPAPNPNPETRFAVVCPVHNTPPGLLEECVRSVQAQSHGAWTMLLVDDASSDVGTVGALDALSASDPRIRLVGLDGNVGIAAATNAGVAEADADYLVFIDHDDVLAPRALEWLSTATPTADIIYTDEDKIDENGAHFEAFFKPAWSPRLLLGVNYVNHITCVRAELFRAAGGLRTGIDGVQDHDLLLRLSERSPVVAHIPNVLYHWRAWSESTAGRSGSKVFAEDRGLRIVQEAIDRRGWDARAGLGNGAPFSYRVLFEEAEERPRVKVVIPTRDRLKMLRRAVEGVLHRTDGVDVHLVIVDNGSRKPKTLRYLQELEQAHDNVSVHRIDDAFNYSRLCNEGVAAGPETRYVLLLNNDVEVLHRKWLLQMTGWLRDPNVIGVGAKLRFPDGTIQHGGVIVGFGGIAGHYAGYEPDEPHLGNLHDQAREVGCLTAACLLLRTADFAKVGGFDEALGIDFQDVDLCLRMRRDLGGVLMYDPTYPLVHVQSASRGGHAAANGYTVARMQFLWGPELEGFDPYYSPHLSMNRHDFALRPLPAGRKGQLERLEARGSDSSALPGGARMGR